MNSDAYTVPTFPLALLKSGNNVFALSKEQTEGDFRCNLKKLGILSLSSLKSILLWQRYSFLIR